MPSAELRRRGRHAQRVLVVRQRHERGDQKWLDGVMKYLEERDKLREMGLI